MKNHSKIYNPNLKSKFTRTFLKIESKKNATIGDKSSMPTGGISFRKGARKISLKARSERKGSKCHLTFGNHDNKIVINNTKNIKSNILATATAKPTRFFLILIVTNGQNYRTHNFFRHQYFRQLQIAIFGVLQCYSEKLS